MRKGEEKEKPTREPTRRKTVERRVHPGCGCTPTVSSWPHSSVTVAWRFVEAVPRGFPFYQRQTVIHSLENKA
jgi:hypothetical protein